MSEPQTQTVTAKLAKVEKGGNIRFGRSDVRSSVYFSKSFFAPDIVKQFFPNHDAEADAYPDMEITLTIPVPDGHERVLSQDGDYVLPGRPAALPTDKDGVEALVEAAEAAKRNAERAQKRAEKAAENARKAQEMLGDTDTGGAASE